MAEMIWRIGVDANEAKRAGQAFRSSANEKKNEQSGGILQSLSQQIKTLNVQRDEATDISLIKRLNKEISSLEKQRTELKGEKKSGGGAFSGGLIGGLLGGILSSVRQLVEPIQAMSTLLVAALFPIFKPFLILFIKVGLLLYKWLSKMTGAAETLTKPNEKYDGVKSATTAYGAAAGGILGAAIGGPVGAGIGAAIGAFIGSMIPNALQGLENIWLIISEWSVWLWDGLVKYTSQAWDVITEWASWLWDGLVSTLSSAWDYLAGLGQWLWDGLVDVLSSAWEYLKEFGSWMWDSLVNVFSAAWDVIKGIGTWMWDALTGVFSTAFDALKGIGTWIMDKIKGFFGGSSSGSSGGELNYGKDSSYGGSGSGTKGGKKVFVSDAIITPNGDIIRTNPSDYLIATKNPQSFGGGRSGGASTINVSINGGLITEDVARKIGQIILKEVKRSGA